MADRTIYQLPVGEEHSSIVELADGKRYRKQLVKFGKWVDPHSPSKKLTLDKEWAERVVANFKNKVLNRVPVPEGHPDNSGDLVTRTRGELMALSIEDDGLYGELEIRDPKTAAGIDNDLVYDVSVSFDPDYVDKRNGENVGPALLHVGLVNDPYLKGMTSFQALSDSANVIMLSESKEYAMSNVTVKNERDFAVTVTYTVDGVEKSTQVEPGGEVEVPEEAKDAVTAQVNDAEAPKAEPTDEEKAAEEAAAKEAADKAEAEAKAKTEADEKAKADLSELDRTKVELAEARQAIATRDAKAAYDKLLHEGKVVPAQEEQFMQLSAAASTAGAISLSDGSTKSFSDVLANFLEAAPKRVDFGEGGSAGDEAKETPWSKLSEGEKEANRKLDISEAEFNKNNQPSDEAAVAAGAEAKQE